MSRLPPPTTTITTITTSTHTPAPTTAQVQVKQVGMLHPEKLLNYFYDILVFILFFFHIKQSLKVTI